MLHLEGAFLIRVAGQNKTHSGNRPHEIMCTRKRSHIPASANKLLGNRNSRKYHAGPTLYWVLCTCSGRQASVHDGPLGAVRQHLQGIAFAEDGPEELRRVFCRLLCTHLTGLQGMRCEADCSVPAREHNAPKCARGGGYHSVPAASLKNRSANAVAIGSARCMSSAR